MAAPARTDPSVCPEGADAIMVLVPCPSLPDDESSGVAEDESDRSEAWVRRAREGVIREMEGSANMHGFGDSIVGEEVYTPQGWRER